MREIILTAKMGIWTKYAGIYLHIWRNKLNIPKKSTLAKYTKMLYVETGIQREQRREIPEQIHARPEKELPESSPGGERKRERESERERERVGERERCSCIDGHHAGR
jgi:hypothetical protein